MTPKQKLQPEELKRHPRTASAKDESNAAVNDYLCCPALSGQEEREEQESEKGKESGAEEVVFVAKKVKKVNQGNEACQKVLAIEMKILSQGKRIRG